MWNRDGESRSQKWKGFVGLAALGTALTLPTEAWAQTTPPPATAPGPVVGPSPVPQPNLPPPGPSSDTGPQGGTGAGDVKNPQEAASTAAGAAAPVVTPPRVVVQTGAPAPAGQNLAQPAPASANQPAPGQAIVKVGGGMILLYSNNYAPKRDATGAKKRPFVDAWRASVILDSKYDRYGQHIEFRARDRGLRWMPTSAWLEECYASVDIMKATNPLGPMTLKVGKSYMMFGRIWDNSFYGSIMFRDGLKLDPNWGLSLEGALGATKKFGTRYFAQFYFTDGQTSTAQTNRDSISITPAGQQSAVLGFTPRKRNQIIGRLEPFAKFAPDMVVRLGGSAQYFEVDYPATRSGINLPVTDDENDVFVKRFGGDIALQLKWFSAWAEYAHQDGAHVNSFPIGPSAAGANPMTSPARQGSSSDNVDYWIAGGNVVWKGLTLQLNYSLGIYRDVFNTYLDTTNAAARGLAGTAGTYKGVAGPRGTYKEWIYNPSIQYAINDQLKIIVEAPFWMRRGLRGQPKIDPAEATPGTAANAATMTAATPAVRKTNNGKDTEAVEQQVVVTIHGRF